MRVKSLLQKNEVTQARERLEKLPVAAFGLEVIGGLKRLLEKSVIRVSPAKSDTGTEDEKNLEALRRLSPLLKGQWVVLTDGKLVAQGKKLKDVLEKVKELKLPGTPLVHLVAP